MNKIRQNPMTESKRRYTFWTAAAALMANFVASAAPIPLMNHFQQTLSMTSVEIAQGIFSYFIGCIVVLVFLSRLSNYTGRKPAAALSIALGVASNLLYIDPPALHSFLAARFLQGLACGIASSAVMSWVIDTAPPRKAWLGTALTAMGPNIGLSIGTAATGLVMYFSLIDPDQLFFVMAVLLSGALVLLLFSGETIPKGMSSAREAFAVKIALPSRLRLIFVATAAAYIGGWGLGSFYQGFSGMLTEYAFGSTSTALAAVTYLCCIVPNPICGIWAGRFSPAPALRIAYSIFFASALSMFWAALHGWGVPFLIFTAVVGAVTGASCSLALKLIMAGSSIEERAGIVSAVYLAAYVGSGIPNLVVMLSGEAELPSLAVGYSFWVAASALFVGAMTTYLIRKMHKINE